MARAALLILAFLPTGCGEPERPHFTPATGQGAASIEAPPPDASRVIVTPKNIEMH